jgi:hypothetical protein
MLLPNSFVHFDANIFTHSPSTIITCFTNMINHSSVHFLCSLRCKCSHSLTSTNITRLTNITNDSSVLLFCSLQCKPSELLTSTIITCLPNVVQNTLVHLFSSLECKSSKSFISINRHLPNEHHL